MNFFAHYFYDRISNDVYHNFGLSLPDWVRNYVPGKKIKKLKPIDEEHKPSVSLAEGVTKHIHRDKVFHLSGYFAETETLVNEALKPAFVEADIQRFWFAGHLLSEMMIDRVLMKEFPEKMDMFYQELEAVDLAEVSLFLQSQGIEDTPTFELRMKRFIEVQYLKKYVEDDAMVYSLNRIFMQMGIDAEWNTDQFGSVQKIIPGIENIIFERMNRLNEEMA